MCRALATSCVIQAGANVSGSRSPTRSSTCAHAMARSASSRLEYQLTPALGRHCRSQRLSSRDKLVEPAAVRLERSRSGKHDEVAVTRRLPDELHVGETRSVRMSICHHGSPAASTSPVRGSYVPGCVHAGGHPLAEHAGALGEDRCGVVEARFDATSASGRTVPSPMGSRRSASRSALAGTGRAWKPLRFDAS